MQRCRKDFTVRELVAELAERGLKVDYRTMWNTRGVTQAGVYRLTKR